MATTAIATLQPVWDCRWSRPGHRFIELREQAPRETHWVCLREGEPRPVLQEECATCTHWEPLLAAAAPVAAAPSITSGERQDVGTRLVIMLTAIGMFAVGFTQLTSMMAIPFVILLWLCAAGLLGIVAFSSLDGNPPPYADSGTHAPAAHAERAK